MTDTGRFITFEGIEGTGKSTQLSRLAHRLQRAGVEVVATREPGGTELGRELRAVLLRPSIRSMSPLAELLLYLTDRVQHLEEVVEPALRRGAVVLCDRFLDATLAYQGHGRAMGIEPILALHGQPPLDRRPDRTILLDLEPDQALDRARRRNHSLGLETSEGRYEAEQIEFHRRVRQGYLELAAREPHRFRVVDARGTADAVETKILDTLRDVLPPFEARSC